MAIITVFRHKTGAFGPAYLTIHDMRIHRLLELFCRHVRQKFLAKNKSEDPKMKDPTNGALTFFTDTLGKKMTHLKLAVNWFKKQFIDEGTHTAEDLRYLSAKDFRSCISSWASDHINENIRLNAAALQNHSQTIHEAVYRKNKLRQAMGQSLALKRDLSKLAGTASDSEVFENMTVSHQLQANIEDSGP